ncbi:MAG: LPS export ABC transporter periplasmic protein LptC [Pseudomonadota bacterium]
MATRDRYSRFVRGAKLTLPLVALALLSTVFLFAGRIDPTQSLPYAELRVDEIVAQQRLSSPIFTAVTSAGDALRISAAQAKPHAEVQERFLAEDVLAVLSDQSGARTQVNARLGDYNPVQNTLHLNGNVVVETPGATRLRSQALVIALDTATMESPGMVSASAAFGDLIAGSFKSTAEASPNASRHWVFQNEVKVIYDPSR